LSRSSRLLARGSNRRQARATKCPLWYQGATQLAEGFGSLSSNASAREELRLLCGDFPSLGDRVISCLADPAPRLSPGVWPSFGGRPQLRTVVFVFVSSRHLL